ncbi:MAG: HupE/UreJ family protein [Bacteroidota bacterium]
MKKQLQITLLLLVWVLSFAPQQLDAHAANQSYVFLDVRKSIINCLFEINYKDLNKQFDLALEENVTLEELTPYLPQMKALFLEKVAFFDINDKKYDLELGDFAVSSTEKYGAFLQLPFTLKGLNEIPDALRIQYGLLFDKDRMHRGMVVVTHNWKAGIVRKSEQIALIYSPGNIKQELSLSDASIWKGFVAMIKEGMWHIWIGIDHILFLLALVLPSVMIWRKQEEEKVAPKVQKEVQINGFSFPLSSFAKNWSPVEKFRPAFMYVIKIVTFFTIAHTVTLSLAALNIIDLPSRIVESIIAFSIALAAVHNIRPVVKDREWLIALGFGLFHGFGFASVLGDIGLSGEFMTYSLLAFNIGVEIGQLLIICAIFPVLYLLRNFKFYPNFLIYGSVVLIFISLYWFIERAFEVDLPLGAFVYKILGLVGLM